ncbi:hypothetical protein OJAV_G00003940 [Oryzias javanicus]|uniref:Uncharacterized protein n=1 Tax=Oryzias javanicus TaxID=123683 RepID=A0A437DMM7_ORYJA|nr:hypothetical protein OJAV_G00003940 [Oryzias javanicus]
MRHYDNEQPGQNNQKRTSCKRLILGFGLLCISQAILNISLRMTLNCSKNPFHCNATDVTVHTLDEAIEIGVMNKYQKLQEKIKALIRDNEILERRNKELMGKCGWERPEKNHTLDIPLKG